MPTQAPLPRLALVFATAVSFVSISTPAPVAETDAAPRARDLGIPFDGAPGPLNAITDVAGVEVGHVTLIEGDGALVVGTGPVRTGVTAILPRGKTSTEPVFAASFALNAAGEMTGTVWLEENGLLEGPVMITNTHSVGVVRDGTVAWMVKNGWATQWYSWFAPVVAETFDGVLNDMNGFHVTAEHAVSALDGARNGPVEEGSVGGGTGMICNQFKGGIGTASRAVDVDGRRFTVGVLVQCNYGARRDLRIAGVPVGVELSEVYPPCVEDPSAVSRPGLMDGYAACEESTRPSSPGASEDQPDGSIIIVVATDAPLLPHQLKRLAKRPALGLGRLGSVAHNGSGDIFIAFSTAATGLPGYDENPGTISILPNGRLTPVFEAAVQATEEAVVNALVAARTMTGADTVKVFGLPHDRLIAVLENFGRLSAPSTSLAPGMPVEPRAEPSRVLGLPVSAWFLILLALAAGPLIVWRFYRSQRRRLSGSSTG